VRKIEIKPTQETVKQEAKIELVELKKSNPKTVAEVMKRVEKIEKYLGI